MVLRSHLAEVTNIEFFNVLTEEALHKDRRGLLLREISNEIPHPQGGGVQTIDQSRARLGGRLKAGRLFPWIGLSCLQLVVDHLNAAADQLRAVERELLQSIEKSGHHRAHADKDP